MEPNAEQILKVDEAGRVWTPRELREAALDEFERSGLPATQFAEAIGVRYSTFASWRQGRRKQREGRAQRGSRRKERGGGKALPWVEVAVDVPCVAKTTTSAALSVHLPGGARMEIGDGAQVLIAAELLRALAAGGGAC